jgi:hypothetical protein
MIAGRRRNACPFGVLILTAAWVGCVESESGDGIEDRAAETEESVAARDACTLVRADEVAAIVGESVVARPEGTEQTRSSCMYESAGSGAPRFGLTVTWRGGRESWEVMQAGTAQAAEVMGEAFEYENVNVDSIVRPGPVAGLGDGAVFSEIMPSAIVEGDVLVELMMGFLPEPEVHFIPLGRKVLERL